MTKFMEPELSIIRMETYTPDSGLTTKDKARALTSTQTALYTTVSGTKTKNTALDELNGLMGHGTKVSSNVATSTGRVS